MEAGGAVDAGPDLRTGVFGSAVAGDREDDLAAVGGDGVALRTGLLAKAGGERIAVVVDVDAARHVNAGADELIDALTPLGGGTETRRIELG
jgi:hypothetical protein